MGDPNNYPVGYDRGHKPTCEWTKCPGGIDCQGLPAEPAPVASRERVAEVLTAHQHVDATGKWLGQYRTEYKCICGQTMTADGHAGISRTDALVDHQKDALLAAGVFRAEAQVKTELVERILSRVRENFSGDTYEENAIGAAQEDEWSWFKWLAITTVEHAAARQAGGPS